MALCEVFFQNIDPLFKILHRPSVQGFIQDQKQYLDYEPHHQAPATLAGAIYLTAACGIPESQCRLLLGTDKRTSVLHLKDQVETDLTKAKLFISEDITVLQAYVLFLVGSEIIIRR